MPAERTTASPRRRRPARGCSAIIALWGLLLALPCAAQQGAAAPLAEVIEMMNQGRTAESLTLLEDMAAQQAGRPWFDRLYGLALLRSGQAARAAMVLQRAALADPQSAEIRLLLARAYLDEGDDEDAERELRLLADSHPPPPADTQIAQLLAGIERRKAAQGRTTRIDAGLSAGYDSNANAGTDSASYLGFTLAPEARRADSPFAEGRLGGGIGAPIAPRWRWSASAQLAHREYTGFDAATRSDAAGALGLHYAQRRLALDSTVSAAHEWLGGSDSRRQLAWEGGVSAATGSRVLASLRLHAGQLRYASRLDSHDVNQWIGSLQLTASPQWTRPVELRLGVIDGVESTASSGGGFGRTLAGTRLGATFIGTPWRIDAGILWSDYDAPFFGESRQDRQWNAKLEADRSLQGTLASAYLAYSRNLSTIDLYAYDRWEIGVAVNWSSR